MTITIFTGNQPRHIALIESLAAIADEVLAVQECNTLFPGQVADFFNKSDIFQAYFKRVMESESVVFGLPRFSPKNVRCLVLKMGDINMLEPKILAPAFQSDMYVIFGASYIKGWICDRLIKNKALNLHVGVSPYYRGNSTNFWALRDGHPELVGTTIHLLTKGLDSGPIVRHAFPPSKAYDPFVLGMCAVRSGQEALIDLLKNRHDKLYRPVQQNRSLEIRYSRNVDFTEDVASHYLAKLPTPMLIKRALQKRNLKEFIHPYVG